MLSSSKVQPEAGEKPSTSGYGFSTLAVHHKQEPEKVTGAVIPPIFLSTTYAQVPGVGHSGYEYSRSGNPTRDALESAVAILEGGKHGLAFGSGLGSQATLFSIFDSGSHVVLIDDAYGGTTRYFTKVATKHGIEVSLVDLRDPEVLEQHIKSNTVMVWIETPTNPTLRIVDIQKISNIIKKKNPKVLLAVDNTLATPFFQKPLLHGADLVSHSATKYINGHSDVVMGLLITNDDELAEKLRYVQNAAGCVTSPFDCFLVHRGLKTLPLRMKKHEENSIQIARLLEASPLVEVVFYPGLESHPQHSIAKKQQTGYGGMISFKLKATRDDVFKFLKALKLFTFAESLGGVESLIEVPSIMTHASVPEDCLL